MQIGYTNDKLISAKIGYCMLYLKRCCLSFCCLLISSVSIAYGKQGNPEELNLNELSEGILFVGLGSYCEAADILRGCGLRSAAFPFDWILTTDGLKLIEILENDFLHFLDEKYLVPAKSSNMVLLQTYYNMEFHHEGEWRGDPNYLAQNMEKLIAKYQRRVERFRQLKDFQGKVVFIRFANKNSLEPNVFYRIKENIEISDENSLRLHGALKKYFPKLSFCLIVVNVHRRVGIEVEKMLLDNLFIIRSNPVQKLSVKVDDYMDYFRKLIEYAY